jgi:hypothetical protein
MLSSDAKCAIYGSNKYLNSTGIFHQVFSIRVVKTSSFALEELKFGLFLIFIRIRIKSLCATWARAFIRGAASAAHNRGLLWSLALQRDNGYSSLNNQGQKRQQGKQLWANY